MIIRESGCGARDGEPRKGLLAEEDVACIAHRLHVSEGVREVNDVLRGAVLVIFGHFDRSNWPF